MTRTKRSLRLGIDIGSTTVKIVIVDHDSNEMLYSKYIRHNARQRETVSKLLEEAKNEFNEDSFITAVCVLYPNVRTTVELGGQDAKVIFFSYDNKKDKLTASDTRMNGSCAGGTGAFIDEIVALLNIHTDKFEELAALGINVYDISGRCGVFAKTDIQPLLIQGAKREDIALSTFHAIAIDQLFPDATFLL